MGAPTQALREAVGGDFDGVLERVAEAHGATTADAVRALPEPRRVLVSGDRIGEILKDLESWGDVLVIVHSPFLVAEIKTAIPPHTPGRGYLNFHGETPFGGHLKEDACDLIAFVDRPFFGRRSLSLQFLEPAGSCIFKVFVRRDEARALIPDQVARFEALRAAVQT